MQFRADRMLNWLPSLTETEQELARHTCRLLMAGEPVRREMLATALNLPTREVVSLLDRWPSHVAYDEWRRITALGGLSLEPTSHRFLVDGTELYTWCAFDSLFLPTMLECTAEVSSTCPATGAPIQLRVSPAGLEHVSPLETALSLRVPSGGYVHEDVRQSFCRYANFFRSREEAIAWSADYDDVHVLPLEEAAQLARRWITSRMVPC